MSETVDVLDELATLTGDTPASPATPASVGAENSGAESGTDSTPGTAGDAPEGDQAGAVVTNASNASNTETPQPAFSKIVATFDTLAEAVAAGYTDLVGVSEFSGKLTVEAVQAAIAKGNPDEAVGAIVTPAAVYQVMKAKGHPLPVVMVDGTALLPFADAKTAWTSRPERGTGGGSTSGASEMTDEKLEKVAFDAQQELIKAEAAVKRAAERLEKAKRTATRREEQAAKRFGTEWQTRITDAAAKREAEATTTEPDNTDATPAE